MLYKSAHLTNTILPSLVLNSFKSNFLTYPTSRHATMLMWPSSFVMEYVHKLAITFLSIIRVTHRLTMSSCNYIEHNVHINVAITYINVAITRDVPQNWPPYSARLAPNGTNLGLKDQFQYILAKKSQICPILGQFDPICMSNLTSLLSISLKLRLYRSAVLI